MGFKFFLRFTGLCAFVPHTSGSHARVLLLNDAHDLARRLPVDVETGVEPVLGHAPQDIIRPSSSRA